MSKNPQSKKYKKEWKELFKEKAVSSSVKDKPSQNGSPFGAIHNSRPTLKINRIKVERCLQFIVDMGLGPTFQRFCDDEGINFDLTRYYDDKRSRKQG